MGENKQLRVDNWGAFFLQRLQTFFNKTDYCDLTLQFDGNVQLKVHRLVMNACTDYFHILEQTCEMIDDVLMMPPDLTPDIILPIVNFMYTGMLEFQMTNYIKLYKAAELMEMPVLTKILDAQKAKYPLRGSKTRSVQQNWNSPHSRKNSPDLPQTLPGRKLPVWKRKSVPTNTTSTTNHQQTSSVTSHFTEAKINNTPEPLYLYDNTPKPTRFEWPEEELTNFPLLDTSAFDDISYTSRQILTQDEEMRSNSSTFDEVKHLPNLNKRPASYNAPQIDIEEVKKYVKEQKVRSELADYAIDEEDVDNDFSENGQAKRRLDKQGLRISKRLKFNSSEKENMTSTSTAASGTTATTKISATVTGEVNHTKIISEVLKKYPHLMKKNKNIRLKILAKSGNKTEMPVITDITTGKTSPVKSDVSKKQPDEGPWTCQKCSTPTEKIEFVLYYLYRKHMTDVHYEKFDSKQCKFCGHKSAGVTMLMYHQYIKHEIKPPSTYKFPKCKQCPYIALSDSMLAKHKLIHSKHDVQCNECKIAFNNRNSLTSHVQITGHTGKLDRTNFDCQYCTKRLPTDSHLFAHIKISHRDEGSRDGIVGIDEMEADEVIGEDLEKAKLVSLKKEDESSKVKILSNVKVSTGKTIQPTKSNEQKVVTPVQKPSQSNQIKLTSETDVAASLGLVDIVVLDDNQQYILQSNPQEASPEYILPDMPSNFTTQGNTSITQTMLSGNSDIASTDELVMVLTDHDYNDGNNEILSSDNSNIVVLYSHPVEGGQENQFITSQGNLIATSQGNLITTQGNLILNSQTGMIELTNADSQMLSQDESIEMIQQEINSHKDYKTDTNLHSDKSNETKIVMPIVEKETVQQIEETEYVAKPDDNLVKETRTEELSTEVSNKMLEDDLSDLVDVKIESEDVSHENVPLEEPVAENVVEHESEVIDKINMIASDQDILNKSSLESSTEISESTSTVVVENVEGDENENNGKDDVIEMDTLLETDTEQTKSDAKNAEDDTQKEDMQEKNNEDLNLQNDANSKDDANFIDVNFKEADFPEQANSEAVNLKEETLSFIEKETNVQDKEGNLQDEEGILQENDIKKEVLESNEETVQLNMLEADGKESEVAAMQVTEANGVNLVNIGEEVETKTNTISSEMNKDIATDLMEVEEECPTINSENDTIVVEEGLAKVTVDELEITTNVICNDQQSDNTNPDDDNSKLSENVSENTSESTQKETTPATKIAILHDWEDTDSQQSEHPDGTHRSENTVNKLITDWEDEEDMKE